MAGMLTGMILKTKTMNLYNYSGIRLYYISSTYQQKTTEDFRNWKALN